MLDIDKTELKIKDRNGKYTVACPQDLSDQELLQLKSKLSEEIFEIDIKMHNPPSLGEQETQKWEREAAQAKRYRTLNVTKINNEMKIRNLARDSKIHNFINCAKEHLPSETFQKISSLSGIA
jgi:hypothetical protein